MELKNMKLGESVIANKRRVIVSDQFKGVDYEITEIKIQGDELFEYSFGHSEHSSDHEHLQKSTSMSKDEAIKDAKEAILQHLKYD